MIKIVALVTKKPGLSREEFIKHYEEVHAPMVLSKWPKIRRYVRNFAFKPAGQKGPPGSDWNKLPRYDSVTEFWFDRIEDWQAMVDAYNKSSDWQEVQDDEKAFMDIENILVYEVEEWVSPVRPKRK